MDGRLVLFSLAVSLMVASPVTLAASSKTPEFCTVTAIRAKEQRMPTKGLKNLHGYKLGSTLLMGLGVGNSKNESVSALPSGAQCTWYFNDGDSEAQDLFNWRDLTKPNHEDEIDDLREEYMSALEWMLDESASPFWSCIEERKAIAMGCDGMKHRGPTVFAMVLSFMGCSANDSVKIVNAVWGTNGIPTSNRIALAEAAYQYGNENPAKRERAVAQFSKK